MKLPIILYIIGSLFFLAGSITLYVQRPHQIPRCVATDVVDGKTYRCDLALQHAYGHVHEERDGFLVAWTEKYK